MAVENTVNIAPERAKTVEKRTYIRFFHNIHRGD
jgi:hypothetical protein